MKYNYHSLFHLQNAVLVQTKQHIFQVLSRKKATLPSHYLGQEFEQVALDLPTVQLEGVVSMCGRFGIVAVQRPVASVCAKCFDRRPLHSRKAKVSTARKSFAEKKHLSRFASSSVCHNFLEDPEFSFTKHDTYDSKQPLSTAIWQCWMDSAIGKPWLMQGE